MLPTKICLLSHVHFSEKSYEEVSWVGRNGTRFRFVKLWTGPLRSSDVALKGSIEETFQNKF